MARQWQNLRVAKSPGRIQESLNALESGSERRFVTGFGACEREKPVTNRRSGFLESALQNLKICGFSLPSHRAAIPPRRGNSFAGRVHFAVKTLGLKSRGGLTSLKFSSPAVAK